MKKSEIHVGERYKIKDGNTGRELTVTVEAKERGGIRVFDGAGNRSTFKTAGPFLREVKMARKPPAASKEAMGKIYGRSAKRKEAKIIDVCGNEVRPDGPDYEEAVKLQ